MLLKIFCLEITFADKKMELKTLLTKDPVKITLTQVLEYGCAPLHLRLVLFHSALGNTIGLQYFF